MSNKSIPCPPVEVKIFCRFQVPHCIGYNVCKCYGFVLLFHKCLRFAVDTRRSSMLIDVPTRAFDDFAGGAQDVETNYRILGLQP